MKNKIEILPQDVVSKIAAGEVVERPASVVKELLENAIDAGSNQITVEVRKSPAAFIRVIDNGSGMDRENALLSFKSYATSKIKDFSDLNKLTTLGFRGEALPSIASVSRMQMITRVKESIEGIQIYNEGGVIKEIKETGAPVGTTITVKDLFFNTPARRKFLKSNVTEMVHLTNIVSWESLSHLSISFKLIHNGNMIINAPQTFSLKERIRDLYGKNLGKDMLKVDLESKGVKIKGLVAKPVLTRAERSFQFFFLNNRWIKSRILTYALYEGYHTLLPVGRHPLTILFIEIDLSKVDINVHPTKREVRFTKEKEIQGLLREAVSQSLRKGELTPEIEERKYRISESRGKYLTKSGVSFEREERNPADLFPKNKDNTIKTERSVSFFQRAIGQVHNTYIVVQTEEGLLLVDQHAAHERILYEKFSSKLENSPEIQRLLVPLTLELSPQESFILKENLSSFLKIGFEIDHFSGYTFLLRGYPAFLEKVDNKQLIFDLIDEIFIKNKIGEQNRIKEKMMIMMACRAAIKAKDKLSSEEMGSLIEQLEKTRSPYTCPHGRPTMIKMTIKELEKRFKRI